MFGDPKKWKTGATVTLGHDLDPKDLPAGWQRTAFGKFKYTGTGTGTSATPAPAPTPTPTPAPTATPTQGTGTAPPASNPFLTKVRQQIMDRLALMGKDPSMDDPALKAQSETYRRSRERGARTQRAEMAERGAANGTIIGGQSSGGFDTALSGIRESASEDIASNDARLIGGEVQQRRAELQSLINIALQSGDAETARELEAQLRREGMSQQDRQFYANIDLQYKNLNQQDRQFLKDLQFRYTSLSQQDKQFLEDLKFRNAQLSQQDRQFLLDLNYRNRTWDDQFGRTLGRDYEDDYRWRVEYGLGK